ncbi:MAG: PP2C family protein-serine/threonine phosphatase [Burkholderiales bacterium]
MTRGANDLPAPLADYLYELAFAGRPLAWLQLNAGHAVALTGGDLDEHGIGPVTLGQPALPQLAFLEGLLPIAESPFVLPAMELSAGRTIDLHLLTLGDDTWIVLIDAKARTDAARRVQQKAYDMTLLSEREANLNRQLAAANQSLREAHAALNASREALLATNQRLARELAEAARYVQSILPEPQATPVAVDWRFIPSTELGGDAFGYHWIDAEHFAFFILDVSGHGVGAALHAATVTNALRSETLRAVDFTRPADVLTRLNEAYPMARHDDLFFSIWYGVLDHSRGVLEYANAGHPPGILIASDPGGSTTVEQLGVRGPPIGITATVTYRSAEVRVRQASRLFLVSDGAFELERPDGSLLGFEALVRLLAEHVAAGTDELDRVVALAHALRGVGPLEDDLSIMRFVFCG